MESKELLRFTIQTIFFILIAQQPHPMNAQYPSSRDGTFYEPRVDPHTCTETTCQLPDCFCAGKEAPLGMDPSVIPQMVMFTFDDAVNEQVIDYYSELFPPSRVNPNGCPVSVTFFVSHNWTDYGMVKDLYDKGHEIASHSITHRMPQSWWRYASVDEWESEIVGQRENIIDGASIPRDQVTGMRAPFLDTGGDAQYEMMQDHGVRYDASFMTGPHDKGGVWPFTMDTVPSWQYCTNLNCPKQSHPGIWQVPLNRWVGIDGNGCSMVDSCQQQPSHKGEALAYLWQNFNRHYYGNRAPVGVNMHATWFQTEHFYEAMKEFVKTISEMDDVYLVTVQQTLEWMKNPQTIGRAESFQPWMRSCGSLQRGGVSNPRMNELPVFNEVPVNSRERPVPVNRGINRPMRDRSNSAARDSFEESVEYKFDNDFRSVNDINDRSSRFRSLFSKEDYSDLFPSPSRNNINVQRENVPRDQNPRSQNSPSANIPRNFIPNADRPISRENIPVNIRNDESVPSIDSKPNNEPVDEEDGEDEDKVLEEDDSRSKSTPSATPRGRVQGTRTVSQRPPKVAGLQPKNAGGAVRRPRPTKQEGQVRQQRQNNNSAVSAMMMRKDVLALTLLALNILSIVF